MEHSVAVQMLIIITAASELAVLGLLFVLEMNPLLQV
jgi:hypothetical protein